MALAASLLAAAARGDVLQLQRFLNARSCPVDAVDENGISALQRAAADGHVEVVQLLLQHGANTNIQDAIHGNTALHEAAWKGYSRCVSLLCASGATSLALRNSGGFAALHLACQNGHNQTCRELLLAGADPDQQNNYGDTSLHTAARYGHAGVTRILISAQCRISDQNKNGDTALHIAAAMGRRKLTRILLEAGCDKALRNHQDETARDIVSRKGLEEIIHILNTPVAKQSKKKDKRRDKSKERVLDVVDAPSKDKKKDKKKKTVSFDTEPPVQWSPYGCHYYPDPKFFPKPKLSSLPTEPLKKGEQYFLDLAGNIKKGPIGAGYTCYCAPFFKHMENKMNEDKKDLKKHIDKAHGRLDQKVADLEMKTQGQISQLTRYVAAERALCKERHEHLEQWLTRGMLFRASERVKKLDFSPRGSMDIPPMKRTRSLELLDTSTDDWRKVHRIIKNFNRNSELYETGTKELHESSRHASKSTEILDSGGRSESPRRNYLLKNSKSSDQLDSGPSRQIRSDRVSPVPDAERKKQQNVTAEIHVKPNRISVSQSPVSVELHGYNEKLRASSRRSDSKSPSSSNRQDSRASTYGHDARRSGQNSASPQNVPQNVWKSQVLQRTADDIRKRVLLEKEISDVTQNINSGLDISQDGYVKIPKQSAPQGDNVPDNGPRRSVQQMIAQVEHHQRANSPEPQPLPRKCFTPTESLPDTTPHEDPPRQPLRPAPILKEKTKSKRFSLHNLIPFPTRKTFQSPPAKETGNNSESSDEDDTPIRVVPHPGPMRNTNLLQTLPLPNYELVSNKSQSPAPQIPHRTEAMMKPYSPIDLRSMVPKDAYFHEIPNRQVHHQMPYREMTEPGLPVPQYCPQLESYNQSGLPTPNAIPARNRNPLYPQNGVFDAMMQDHIMREMERIPHCYGEHLNENTEVEIAKDPDDFRGYYYNNRSSNLEGNFRGGQVVRPSPPDHNLLHSRLQSLAINTHLSETQSQLDRESHNDSGYSTKVYGSSQGPSPSLSGHVDDNLSGQRVAMGNGRPVNVNSVGTTSLV